MPGQGTVLLDFGTFPGASDASVSVAAPAIGAGSLAEAWIFPAATSDHTADEHMVETIKVFAGGVQAGVGFTVYGFNTSEILEPVQDPLELLGRGSGTGQAAGAGQPGPTTPSGVGGGIGTRVYGKWNIGWVWN